MVKLVYCLCRRPDISPEAFHRYWLEVHAPKVKRVAETMRALRYVQSHTCEPGFNQALRDSRGLLPAYDSITEIWWNSMEDVTAAMAQPIGAEVMAMLLEDESHFIDFARSTAFMATEHVIFDR